MNTTSDICYTMYVCGSCNLLAAWHKTKRVNDGLTGKTTNCQCLHTSSCYHSGALVITFSVDIATVREWLVETGVLYTCIVKAGDFVLQSVSIVYCVGCCVYSQDMVMWALSEAL